MFYDVTVCRAKPIMQSHIHRRIHLKHIGMRYGISMHSSPFEENKISNIEGESLFRPIRAKLSL